LKAERQQRSAVAVGEEAEVADADETGRQEVEQKTAQELFNSQGHEPLLVAVGGIAPAEGDVAIGKKNDRENEEDYDPDIRIIDMTPDLERQYKQPGDPCGRDQKYAGQTHPMLSQHQPRRSVLASVHGFGLYALPLEMRLIQRFRVAA
jgi:hypothetical protein